MSSIAQDAASTSPALPSRIARKMWREVSRPVRRLSQRMHGPAVVAAAPSPIAAPPAGDGAPTPARLRFVQQPSPGMDPQLATMEPEALPFLRELVRRSRQFPGPIIEIGTLLGVTTTHMALAKAPEQKIITVDVYCWNPWYVPAEIHEAMTAQVLYYLTATGQVERVKMDKDEFYRTYRGPAPALVFLDAMHDYENTKRDIEWAQRAGAKIISGHDYSSDHPGVMQIVDELGGPRELVESVWVL
jgi:hypothetical protein